jgi:hypothetical protein
MGLSHANKPFSQYLHFPRSQKTRIGLKMPRPIYLLLAIFVQRDEPNTHARSCCFVSLRNTVDSNSPYLICVVLLIFAQRRNKYEHRCAFITRDIRGPIMQNLFDMRDLVTDGLPLHCSDWVGNIKYRDTGSWSLGSLEGRIQIMIRALRIRFPSYESMSFFSIIWRCM